MKSIALGSAMLAMFGAANAANFKGDVPFTEDYVMNTYV